ncbi:hypothetical protein Dsin_000488 [Dipteronia sinensis]|uniref:SHSP domain-containing protein n=1 Tax=Dipteronia sinensis TaxID=43782 RepID=A0AAE0EI31_9ROSI|nr:hypothetical protein Dsin_000488 [Dipteronia sinensis]
MAHTHKTGDDEVVTPISEWKEEPENNILTVHLPDFTKEQIKITCVKFSRMVRVHGDRKVANNKWCRFNETFQIPVNCQIDKIHAKWHNESLIVTMPKENITPIAPKEELKTPKVKEPTNTAQQPLPSKQGDAATTGSGISERQNEKKSSAIISPPNATPSIHGENQTDGKRVVDAHQKDEKDTRPQKGTEETSQKLSSISNTSTKQKTDDDKTLVPKPNKLDEHKEKSEDKIKEIPPKLKQPENVVMGTKSTTTEKKEGKKGKTEEKKSNIAADALKAVMEQTEERRLIINMGVAVLVIVALGAYVSYSFATKSKTSKS